ncbi:unnamed protein product [Staurois parvus]|uniref:Uncharacterized protein n=1 Tax=Staurois parvus TaxID=386267 RepID=A0ABN9BUC8_9NEOB|nr:unnamed protein product [Staurois parvus]
MWARTQGPHDPLLPGGPMSCQSAPAEVSLLLSCRGGLTIWKFGHCRGPGVSRGPHEMPLVPFS